MRFLMMVKASKESEAGQMPEEKDFATMARFNDELAKAGALLDLAGLHPTSRGARVYFKDGKRTVVDGPFAEAKELVGGYWLVQLKSLDEAVEWARRVPFDEGEAQIEIRRLFDPEDFAAH